VSYNLVSGFECAGRDDVDVSADQVAQLLSEVLQVEEGAAVFEIDDEVDVTARCGISAGGASEDMHTPSAMARGDGESLLAALHEDRAVPTTNDELTRSRPTRRILVPVRPSLDRARSCRHMYGTSIVDKTSLEVDREIESRRPGPRARRYRHD
jgi:hypothetical protein